MSGRWAGDEDGELWQVEIEHDCFTEGRPFVVSLLVRDYCDGEGQSEALATPSADEAREMAAALIAAADNADKANARIAGAR